ncbi:cytochrome c [Thioalkalicoccus limnaeus]
MSGSELDTLFRGSPAGPIPVGRTRGTAILFAGSWFGRLLSVMIRVLFWKGKIFRPQSGDLKNRVGPLGWRLIRAAVSEGDSWFADGPAVILDYSQTSFLARKIRDEIRLVSPGLYLGVVYWGKRRIARFTLESDDQGEGRLAGFTKAVGVVTLATLLIGGAYVAIRLADDRPVTYALDEDHFKYGSTGGERGFGKQLGFGIPYWMWVALPELFPEYLPDGQTGVGYRAFGMIYEPDRDPRLELPIGMSMRRVQGIDRVYFNCAVCHTGTVRAAPGEPAEIVLGMPANTFDLGALAGFLGRAATDWRFRSDRMLPKIEELARLQQELTLSGDRYQPQPLDALDRAIFRYVGIALMREQLLTLTSRLAFMDMTTWGPGRVDTFNPPKALLGFPMEKAPERELVGNADLPSVWNQRWKQGMQLHWDGNNTSVDERNLSAAFGTGATPTTLDKDKVLRVAAWLWDKAQPPDFPEPFIDRELAARGKPVYQQYCWSCHGNREPPYRTEGDGGLVGTVTPIAEIGTDRARLDSYTRLLAVAQNSLYAGFPADEAHCRDRPGDLERCYPARFSHFRKTYGYANLPLDGLWLRAPYLHNGSVPTLYDLLEPAENRPEVFHIGYDVYDYQDVGFVSFGPDAERQGWRYDTRERGNGNGGHDYGTLLAPDLKEALIEYLKTF